MLVTIAPTIPAAHHHLVRDLLDIGFAGVDHHDVDVHIRSRPPRVRWVVRYRIPLEQLAPDVRQRWLTADPEATSAVASRSYQRRHDAMALAGQVAGSVHRHVDERLAERMSANAYYSLPSIARVRAGTRYLVTMRLPRRLDALTYPQQLQYRRTGVVMATAPVVQVCSWLEELVHLAAHEPAHVRQFRLALRKSEVDAERWAAEAVERFRQHHDTTNSHTGR
ncbi:MAG: hypothetical protein ACLGI2_14475 [Acidimicrobiia bacterium]